jgi:hypothetical protein
MTNVPHSRRRKRFVRLPKGPLAPLPPILCDEPCSDFEHASRRVRTIGVTYGGDERRDEIRLAKVRI